MFKITGLLKVLFFVTTLLVILSGLSSNSSWLNLIFKPLLMPLLALYFLSQKSNHKKQILLALFFSWLGDLFLMFQHQKEIFFMLGLLSFLIAHIWYIVAFWMGKTGGDNIFKQKPWLFILILSYQVLFLLLLYPKLGDLFLPVAIYATVICAMLAFSIWRLGHVNTQSFWLTFVGAFLFVLSDTTIAINKFLMPFSLAYPIIILLYCLGQYLIVRGIVKEDAT